jgi:hypothetical protein
MSSASVHQEEDQWSIIIIIIDSCFHAAAVGSTAGQLHA